MKPSRRVQAAVVATDTQSADGCFRVYPPSAPHIHRKAEPPSGGLIDSGLRPITIQDTAHKHVRVFDWPIGSL